MTFFVAKSSAYKNIYPENIHSCFKFQLMQRGEYNHAILHEIIIPPIKNTYIARAHLNIVSQVQLGDRSTSLFRLVCIQASEKSQSIQFANPHQAAIACPFFDELSFTLIDDATDKLIEFPEAAAHDAYVIIEFKK